jgi:hypothetical protein
MSGEIRRAARSLQCFFADLCPIFFRRSRKSEFKKIQAQRFRAQNAFFSSFRRVIFAFRRRLLQNQRVGKQQRIWNHNGFVFSG